MGKIKNHYWDELTDFSEVPKKRLNDATPQEWDAASRQEYDTCEDIGFPSNDDYDAYVEHMKWADVVEPDSTVTLSTVDNNTVTFNVKKTWDSFFEEAHKIDLDIRVDYKYNEGLLIEELKEYVDSTYNQHYSQNKFQTTEFIIDNGHGMGFCLGNVTKYAQRYGKKDGYNRKDLMKVLHYALIALHVHDLEHGENDEN